MPEIKFIVHEGCFDTYKVFTIMHPNGLGCLNGYVYNNKPKHYIHQYLSVVESSQRNGIGSALIEKGELIAKEQGCTSIAIYVLENEWMRDWYERLGYKENDSKKDGNYVWMGKSLIKKSKKRGGCNPHQ